MARILLSAYACEPGRGSEPGVGWSWATELARMGHEVTVITRAANRRRIESQAAPDHLSFLYFDLPRWTQPMRSFAAGKAFYYVVWQWLAARYLRRHYRVMPFDIVQHVTYVSARYPSFMGSLGIPFYFGPVSGGERVPPPLRAGFSASERCREVLRDLSNRLVALDPLMRRAFRQASRILVTPDTLPLLPRSQRAKAEQTLAVGLPQTDLLTPRKPEPTRTGLRVLYIGRLLEWKGVHLSLHALKLARSAGHNVTLTLVGDGPARPRLVKLARELQLDGAVEWRGWVPHEEVCNCYAGADLLLFPSLRDSGGVAVLEALAHGVPVVCTDLGGPGQIVDRTCGRVLATHDRSPADLAQAMAATLGELASSPSEMDSLSAGALRRSRQFQFADLVRSVYPQPAASARTA